MSGVWYEGQWYPHTGYQCRRCGHPVFETDLKERGYEYQCFHCDEDWFGFEVDKERAFPRVVVARPVDGITLNTALEYLLDEKDEVIIFKNQLEAEAYLLERDVPEDDFLHLHFLIYDGVPEDDPEEEEDPEE